MAAKRASRCAEAVADLLQINDPPICLLILHSCPSMTKLTHVFRTTHPDHLTEATQNIGTSLKKAMEWIILGNAHLSDFHALLASLPLRYGGLGIARPDALFACSYLGFQCMLQSYLFIPLSPKDFRCTSPGCSTWSDSFGYHCLSCKTGTNDTSPHALLSASSLAWPTSLLR